MIPFYFKRHCVLQDIDAAAMSAVAEVENEDEKARKALLADDDDDDDEDDDAEDDSGKLLICNIMYIIKCIIYNISLHMSFLIVLIWFKICWPYN